MSMHVEHAGRRVAANLAAAEDLANQTLHAHATLMQSMMDVRTQTDVAPYEGMTAVMRVQSAMSKLVEAQADIAKAHKSLRDDFTRITAVPDDGTRCPTEKYIGAVKTAA
ncbi:hypothetical protein [Aurantiacibacter rhizosphaerae]|uniref:Uncharacterized protein n=1 Tax=Aurantiacibacter rhizosphaerae TaxID=2691582 RepID=A0A844X9J0_9SPHN|nr:hypothetical protein [Aurantiacibacter rhizosphaerae]MWV27007.1 hypothetical protein [Aurantiacibacter rhizosphaerae]